MSFIESPRFPDEVSAWMIGGEEFMTDIVMVNSGSEQRNQIWSFPLRKYSLSNGLRTIANAVATKSYFRSVAGRANGFRVRDPLDNSVDATTGVVGTGVGTGTPAYQLAKKYISGSFTSTANVIKPVVGSVALFRNSSPVTAGNAAGQYALATTTGIVTFVADSNVAATSITAGATTLCNSATNPSGLTAGKLLYLQGFTGNDAALVNNIAHTINSVTGAGPFQFTLATNTSAKTITLGTGRLLAYPQIADALTWTGEFDIPVRFDVDWLQIGLDPGGLINWSAVNLIELRNP